MKKIPVEQAIGQQLFHDVTAIMDNGFKGVQFKRGHVISQDDVTKLKDIGKYHVYIEDGSNNKIHEEDAGKAIANAIMGDNVSIKGMSEGKYTIVSDIDGMFFLNRDALRNINLVDDITIACIPNHMRVNKGSSLAGARIVPLTTERKNVEKVEQIAKANEQPVLSVLPYQPLKTGVIITGSEVYYGRIKDAFEPILREKLAFFGASIVDFIKCPDDADKIEAAAQQLKDNGAQVVLFTGGMSVDPDDITPDIIRNLCTDFITQGVPMQPGNMLTMGYWNDTFLMGIPGASMHSKITSADLFLALVFTSQHITKEHVSDLGEGGLCMGCEECTFPICTFGRK